MDQQQYLRTETEPDSGVLTIILDRQGNEKNQFDSGMIRSLESALAPAFEDIRIRGVILASSRPKVFSTGADIESELGEIDQDQAAEFCREGRRVFKLFTELPCPTVAAVSGFVLGGGCEVALCCDFRIAAENARIGLPEINLGIIPGWGGTQRLQRLIGQSRALLMILSGEPVNAAAALDIGLIDQIVPGHEDLIPAAMKLIGKFSSKSRSAVRSAKLAVLKGGNLPLDDGLEIETEIFAEAWGTADREEGIRAFLEKRKARWPG